MINTRLLKAKMVEKSQTIESLAQSTDMSATSFSYKLNNKKEFKGGEISKIADALELNKSELCNIFFENVVD